jgi:hypothetical protein
MEQESEQLVVPRTSADEGRHFLAVFFLSFMWGTFGVDRFYLGKIGTGILKLVTFGGFGVWVLIDLVLVMAGSMRDKQGRPMREFVRYKKFASRTVLIFALVLGAVMLIGGVALIYAATQIINVLTHGNPANLTNLLQGGSTQIPTDLLQ